MTEEQECRHYPLCPDIETHFERLEYGAKLRSIQFADCSPRGIEVRQRDKQFAKDAAAYRRLKAQGIQPRGTNRVAELEANMTHPIEAKLGRKITKNEQHAITAAAGNSKHGLL